MSFTVSSIAISSVEDQIATLALLIFELHELITLGFKLNVRSLFLEYNNQDEIKLYITSGNSTLDAIMIIREADLTLHLWDAGRSKKLLKTIYSLEIKLQAVASSFENRLIDIELA